MHQPERQCMCCIMPIPLLTKKSTRTWIDFEFSVDLLGGYVVLRRQ